MDHDIEAVHADAVASRIARAKDAARRGVMAEALAAAIARCDPRDACAIMAAALDDLSAGVPEHVMAEGSWRRDALIWADCAHEAELVAYVVAGIEALGARPLGLRARKRLLVALFKALPEADRRAFLARVDPRGVFTGRAA